MDFLKLRKAFWNLKRLFLALNAASHRELFKNRRSKEWRKQFHALEPKFYKLTYDDIKDYLIWGHG